MGRQHSLQEWLKCVNLVVQRVSVCELVELSVEQITLLQKLT